MRRLVEIVSIWGAGLLVGLALRVSLRRWQGVHFSTKRWGYTLLLPPGRVAFWICVTSGLLLGLVLLVKAMLRDLGLR
jgi:hypothetical protein